MSAIRRAGVIAEYGSLEAYRDYVIEGRDNCATRLHRSVIGAMSDMDNARAADLRMALADWKVDLAWVDAELASEREIA
ncbi:hypothetical protein MKK69_22860 [Methylobacterium sp. J-026]|jgi:hypothetical protein|uniref:hypothetical protein n=1 Tax=unclassified Methylobacterium TaxID=2615210 RepID=UPI0011CA613F|nr:MULTISPECIES: hypothetical protein [unclassified Methylobacterium]MCJ2136856.1 hypothetical protein [Methylobacterium sp. J-026]TXM71120.1 hypothetical protein FV229_00110 [Methylobacterium sp. WL120]